MPKGQRHKELIRDRFFSRTERERECHKELIRDRSLPEQREKECQTNKELIRDRFPRTIFWDTFFSGTKKMDTIFLTPFFGTKKRGTLFPWHFFLEHLFSGITFFPGKIVLGIPYCRDKKNGRTFSQDNFFQDTSFEKYILAFLDSRTRKELKIVVAVSKTKSCPGRKVSPFFDLE